jgi:photosystem II stability/assembly factor-like uncharacterized protein
MTPQPATEPRLFTIAFRDSDVGLVAGSGIIERTADKGAHWTRVSSEPVSIWQIRWRGLTDVFAATDGGLIASADAGVTWKRAVAREPLVDVWMLSPVNGFAIRGRVRTDALWLPLNQAVAGEVLLRTEDGGATWSAVDTGLPFVQSVWFANDKSGWTAGPKGIASTSDAGRTWALQLTVPDGTYDGWGAQLTFIDSENGFASFRTQSTSLSRSGKDIYYTADGGRHWTLESTSEQRAWGPDATANPGGAADGPLVMLGPTGAAFLSTGIAVASTFVRITHDRGRTWSYQQLPYRGSGVGQLLVQADVMWVVLSDGIIGSPPSPSVVLRSLDGGATWQLVL